MTDPLDRDAAPAGAQTDASAPPPASAPRVRIARPGFGHVLIHWFWDTFDHMGRLLTLNAALFLATAPLVYALFIALGVSLRESTGATVLVALLAIGLGVLQLGPVTIAAAGLLHFAGRISEEKDPPMGEFLRGVWAMGRRVLGLMIVWVMASTVLMVNAWFYVGPMRPQWLPPMAGAFLSGLCVWLAAAGVGVMIHAVVLRVRSRHTLGECLRLGALLALKYPVLTTSTVIFAASLIVIGVWLWLVGVLLWGFVAPALLANALHDVIAEFEEDAARPDLPPPMTWAERKARDDEDEERRMRRARYQRTFRDVIRPWEE